MTSKSSDEKNTNNPGVNRISVSLPEGLLEQFDKVVEERGFVSRSQAIADLIQSQLTSHREEQGQDIMAGTINVVYDHAVPGLQKCLSDLQYEFLDEVISVLNVNLVHHQTLSVFLVQGPVSVLKQIENRMITQRGVISAQLLLSTAILPPVHPLPENK